MFFTSTLTPSSVCAARAQRDVGVAAERSLLEVAVVDADVHEDLTQAHQVLARRLRRAQVRFADDLHERARRTG